MQITRSGLLKTEDLVSEIDSLLFRAFRSEPHDEMNEDRLTAGSLAAQDAERYLIFIYDLGDGHAARIFRCLRRDIQSHAFIQLLELSGAALEGISFLSFISIDLDRVFGIVREQIMRQSSCLEIFEDTDLPL